MSTKHQITRAELTDGHILVLEKDCSCLTHSGPHWLHMDRFWYESNQELKVQGNYRGFLVEEIARLKMKSREMRSHRICKLFDKLAGCSAEARNGL